MPKTYLRYEPDETFNIVVTQPGSIYDKTGRFVLSPALNKLRITVSNTNQLQQEIDFNINSTISVISQHPQIQQVAVGFKNGQIIILDVDSLEQVHVFHSIHHVTAMIFSPDGTALVAGHANGEILIFDLMEGVILKQLDRHHNQQVSCLAFYKEYMISGSRDRIVNIWLNFQRFQVLADFSSQIIDIQVINDLLLVATEEIALRVYSFGKRYYQKPAHMLLSGETLSSLETALQERSLPKDISFQENDSDKHLIVFEMEKFERNKGKISKLIQKNNILLIQLESSVETYLIRSLKDVSSHRKSRIQKLVKQRLERPNSQLDAPVDEYLADDILSSNVVIAIGQKIINLDILPYSNGSLYKLVMTCNNHIRQMDIDPFKMTFEPTVDDMQKGHYSSITSVCFNDDFTLLFSSSHESLKIWSVRKAICIQTIELPDQIKTVTNMVVLKGNMFCLLGDSAGIIYVVDIVAGCVANAIQLHDARISSLLIYQNQLYSSSHDGFIKISSLQFTQTLQIVQEREHNMGQLVQCLALSNKFLIAGLADFTAKCMHRDSFKYKFSFYGHNLSINQMIISSTEERVFTISADKTLRVWGLQFGECMKLIKLQELPLSICLIPDTHLAFIAQKDGQILYMDLDSYINICHIGEGNYGQKYAPGHFGACNSLIMAGSGRFFISVGMDNCIRMWLQSNDLVSVDDEFNKTNQRFLELEAMGKNAEWDGQVKTLEVAKMDLIESIIDDNFCIIDMDESGVVTEEQRDYKVLHGLLHFNKQLLPIYIQNLSQSRSFQLYQLLVKVIIRTHNEQIVWILLRLIRTNLVGTDLVFKDVAKLMFDIVNQHVDMADYLIGKVFVDNFVKLPDFVSKI